MRLAQGPHAVVTEDAGAVGHLDLRLGHGLDLRIIDRCHKPGLFIVTTEKQAEAADVAWLLDTQQEVSISGILVGHADPYIPHVINLEELAIGVTADVNTYG